jgi:hypothetical protein
MALPTNAAESARYGSLGDTPTFRHTRTITTPISLTDVQHVFESSLQPYPETPGFNDCFRAQTMVSLRGGWGKNSDSPRRPAAPPPAQAQQPTQPIVSSDPSVAPLQSRPTNQSSASPSPQAPPPTPMVPGHDETRQYIRICPFAQHWYHRPAFVVPISSGDRLDTFMQSISRVDVLNFQALFGLHMVPDTRSSTEANARRVFFRRLSSAHQHMFMRVIWGREEELYRIEQGSPDPQVSVPPNTRSVMLFHLLEALEQRYMPPPSWAGTAMANEYLRRSTTLPHDQSSTPVAVPPVADGPDIHNSVIVAALQAARAQRPGQQLPNAHTGASQVPNPPPSRARPNNLGMRTSSAPNFGQQRQQSRYLATTDPFA